MIALRRALRTVDLSAEDWGLGSDSKACTRSHRILSTYQVNDETLVVEMEPCTTIKTLPLQPFASMDMVFCQIVHRGRRKHVETRRYLNPFVTAYGVFWMEWGFKPIGMSFRASAQYLSGRPQSLSVFCRPISLGGRYSPITISDGMVAECRGKVLKYLYLTLNIWSERRGQ